MRPTARPQSAFRSPLNDILGTEVNVRILRVLSESDAPVSAAALARETKLQRSSVHRALKTLEETGIVTLVGAAPGGRMTLSERSPLARPIRVLFLAERARYDDLLSGLTRLAGAINPPPVAVWIQGPITRGLDRPGDPVMVCLLGGPRTVGESAEQFRNAVKRLERKVDVTVEVRGMTTADLDALPPGEAEELGEAALVFGIPPSGLGQRRPVAGKVRGIRSHSDHEARSLERAQRIADALRRDPALVARSRRYVERRLKEASPGERRELAEWKRILESASPARLRKILTDPGERGTRLRQTLPFLGILPDDDHGRKRS